MNAPQEPLAGRYRLLDPLGDGGMGRMWLARDEVLHRDVAIKEIYLPAGLSPSEREELRNRTLREARTAARLSHPNVVQIYDVLGVEDRPWIVMEYIRSKSLQQTILENGTLDFKRAAAIGLAIVGALKAAHSVGILHRDVKPGNVLIAEDGRVVLTDFGLATFESDDSSITRPGLVWGSPEYVSPERARHGVSSIEADLWSLGATLYAAVEGVSPYDRSTAMASLTALATERPPTPQNAGPLKPVISGLLRKEPRARLRANEVERMLLQITEDRQRRFSLWRQTPIQNFDRETQYPPAVEPVGHVDPLGGAGDESISLDDRSAVFLNGFTDTPADRDLFDRGSVIEVLAEFLTTSVGRPLVADEEVDRPRVIVIDGAWGCGKSTMLRLAQRELHELAEKWTRHVTAARGILARLQYVWESRRITPAAAHRILSKPAASIKKLGIVQSTGKEGQLSHGPPVVVSFEPWAHRTSEEVWAGLAQAITGAIHSVASTKNAAERFWFARNCERLDVNRLRVTLRKGVISPLLKISVFAALVPLIVQFLRSDTKWTPLGISPLMWAAAVPATLLLLGLAQTAFRYFFGRAATWLPAELFAGPIMSNFLSNGTGETAIQDPLNHARSGSLYLIQHDVSIVLAALRSAGRELVVFVDDLDRCDPETAVEVLRAINLFLSGTLTGARFVLGLDQSILARQIDTVYSTTNLGQGRRNDSDPSIGWSFLRKLVQLPIIVPRLSDETFNQYVDTLLDSSEESFTAGPKVAQEAKRTDSPSKDRESNPTHTETLSSHLNNLRTSVFPTMEAAERARADALERNEEVRAAIRARLATWQNASGREAKRLLNVWLFYIRVILRGQQAMPPGDAIVVATTLVTVSEIIARWPAMVRYLTGDISGERAIIFLAGQTEDNGLWKQALRRLELDGPEYVTACNGLRELLRGEQGAKVSSLFAKLL